MLLTLGTIAYQDLKDRLVWWFLFPMVALFGGYLHFVNSFKEVFIYTVSLNILIVCGVVGVVWLYNKFILKKSFLNEALGLGDILFLFAFAIIVPSLSFIVFLVFSLFFALTVHLVLKSFRKNSSIPLAGYMAIFLTGVYLVFWSGLYSSFYLL